MFTDYQSLYFAHWLTLSSNTDNQVSRAIASAKVDMNPHQIEAACFALKSPLAKGVLLADEVGLGKTIEASLVIAQKWAERKRKILLVVPASLRKQWMQELIDKFELPSLIIDSKIARDLSKSETNNIFEQQDNIVICSYEYVANQKISVGDVHWDLVVFDEAHKLRNLYKKSGNKRAKDIHEATLHASSKLLLSATPIQNNLMELYGLSKMVDQYYFGDAQSFRALYVNRQNNKTTYDDLKQRIKPLCFRSLRRQVQQEGGINFTNRYSLTQDFTPSGDEWQLYQNISEYLSRPHLNAIASNARPLVTIGIRKILASSSFAIADTLKGMIKRLEEKKLLDEDDLTDLEEANDWIDSYSVNDSATDNVSNTQSQINLTEISQLQKEIDDLKAYQLLAENIKSNAKGDALLVVLTKALTMTETLGGQRKAVVFTESCRTQKYLKTHLEDNGYKGRLVVLNGSNTDPESRATYKEWIQKHTGSVRVSGSKSADMKAALVDKFKSNQADILVSTEAGGEGINLQFCSVLINYDLPWNPQKVEQRIGRVHRYGQKNDVVVVNFVNRKNPADKRVFELLSSKFKLFEGVFGASDEILGAIESEIDIEKRIAQIYQKCRSDDEIEYQFDQLQQDMQDVLVVREEVARQSLLNNFDRDVVAALKTRRDRSNDFLESYQQVLMDLAKAELPDAIFFRNYFQLQDQRYDLSWELAKENDSDFFRLQASEHFLAWELVKQAMARKPVGDEMDLAHLTFNYNKLDGHYAALQPRVGQSGILSVVKLRLKFAETKEEHLLVIAQTESGEQLPCEDAEHLLRIPAIVTEKLESLNTDKLSLQIEEQLSEKELQTEKQLEEYFEQENTKLERWADDRRQALFFTVEELDREIKEIKREARQLKSLADKLEGKRIVKKKVRERDKALNDYNQAKKQIEEEEDRLLDEMESKLEITKETETLFSIRWTLNS